MLQKRPLTFLVHFTVPEIKWSCVAPRGSLVQTRQDLFSAEHTSRV